MIAAGPRTAVHSSAYMAFPGMVLENGDDLRLLYRYGLAHASAGGESSIDQRVSTDLGLTWPTGGQFVVTPAAHPNDLRDPCVVRLASGRLVVAYSRRTPYTSQSFRAYVKRTDNSTTWSSESALPTPYAGPIKSFASGQPVQVGGQLIVTGYAGNGGPLFVVLWRSSDAGVTFSAPEVIAQHATRDYCEPQLRVTATGDWIVLMRSESDHRTWRTIRVGGVGPWSEPAPVNEMTGRPDFVEYEPSKLVQFGRYQTTGDSPGYYAESADDGATWTTPQRIDPTDPGLWMYGAPVVVPDGVVLVYALEASPSSCGLYRRVFTETEVLTVAFRSEDGGVTWSRTDTIG